MSQTNASETIDLAIAELERMAIQEIESRPCPKCAAFGVRVIGQAVKCHACQFEETATPGQVFTFNGDGKFEVSWAISLTEQFIQNHEIMRMPIENGITALRTNRVAMEGMDWNHVMTVDVTKPIIAVPSPIENGCHIIIDGWHRIARCIGDGLEFIPVVVLTQEESKYCMIALTIHKDEF